MFEWMTVADAAERLGVDPRQVRALIASSGLEAERFGSVWMVSTQSVTARRRQRIEAGRPLAAATTWRLLERIDCAVRGLPVAHAEQLDRRQRHRLRTHQLAMPDVDRWDRWLRRRGVRHRVWFHPAAAESVAADHRVERPDVRLAFSSPVTAPLYIDHRDFDAVVDMYRGQPHVIDGAAGVVDVVAVPDLGDVAWRPHVVAAALVDLSSDRDARVRFAATEKLQDAATLLRGADPDASER